MRPVLHDYAQDLVLARVASLQPMKKLLVLAVLVGLGILAAQRLRSN
jgi:hypothetical protein